MQQWKLALDPSPTLLVFRTLPTHLSTHHRPVYCQGMAKKLSDATTVPHTFLNSQPYGGKGKIFLGLQTNAKKWKLCCVLPMISSLEHRGVAYQLCLTCKHHLLHRTSSFCLWSPFGTELSRGGRKLNCTANPLPPALHYRNCYSQFTKPNWPAHQTIGRHLLALTASFSSLHNPLHLLLHSSCYLHVHDKDHIYMYVHISRGTQARADKEKLII